jgi:hypothetical protein
MSICRPATLLFIAGLTLSPGILHAQTAATPATAAAPQPPQAPTVLPGKGLAQHDFLYTGESANRKIYIVRHGDVVWSYDDPNGKGEISDAVMLSNGNILFAHQFAITEISPDKKVVWNYDVPAGHEVHTAVPIGTTHVLFVQNGDPAILRVVNTTTGAIEKELPMPVANPKNTHLQFRHVRLTSKGTLLVAHMDLNKVVEYDSTGKELWSFPAPSAWSVDPLANGNVLITDRTGVREVTRRGDTVWSWLRTDTPDYRMSSLQQAWRLPNGNTVINNWATPPRQKPGAPAPTLAQTPVQAIELTPDKKVVWALRSWVDPANLGPSTTFQFLDSDPTQTPAPEDVHFGDIR